MVITNRGLVFIHKAGISLPYQVHKETVTGPFIHRFENIAGMISGNPGIRIGINKEFVRKIKEEGLSRKFPVLQYIDGTSAEW